MYNYTKNNLLKQPNNYQFSDISDEKFLTYYKKDREEFLKNISKSIIDKYTLVVNLIEPISKNKLLKLQKEFEVKKRFFEEEKKNLGFLALLSFHIGQSINNTFCYSLFSTQLKINDTLSSIPCDKYSHLESFLIKESILIEQAHFNRILNEL